MLALLALTLAPVVLQFPSKPPARALERKAQILRELEEPGLPGWAGEYTKLLLAPRSGSFREVESCFALHHELGTIAADGNRIEITREGPSPRTTAYWSVPWGARHYLVPEGEMRRFCMQINDGTEPRISVFGLPLLRQDSGSATGKPELPERWARLLLDAPLETTVLAITRCRGEFIDGHPRPVATRVVLPLGTQDGVTPELGFHLGRKRYWIRGYVESVDVASCILLLDASCEGSAEHLEVGSYAGTRYLE
jgi:hypothetical protein